MLSEIFLEAGIFCFKLFDSVSEGLLFFLIGFFFDCELFVQLFELLLVELLDLAA